MLNNWSMGIFILLFCLNAAGAATPPMSAKCGDIAMVSEWADGVFLRSGHDGEIFRDAHVANIGFIVGTASVAVIDTGGSLAEGRALLCAIRQVTTLPVAYVINTHVHPDHVLGNGAFRQSGVQFIGRAHLKRAMQMLGPTYLTRAREAGAGGELEMVLPDTEISDSLTLDLGGRTLMLRAMPQAHTDNDLIVVDSKTNTWWLSDLLFEGHIPVIGGSGSVNGWIAVLEKLRAETMALVVPGHGDVQHNWEAARVAELGYLNDMRDAVRQWIADDKGLASAVEQIGQTQAAAWRMADAYHKRNISYFYAELEWE